MPKSASIFDKQAHLTPSQLRTVADRRFGDARYLADAKGNERMNGAMYMAGFVIECLLKAALLKKYPGTGNKKPSDLTAEEVKIRRLLYSHDLDQIFGRLPELAQALTDHDKKHLQDKGDYAQTLKQVFSWSIYARYSTSSANRGEAQSFVQSVKELRAWLAQQE